MQEHIVTSGLAEMLAELEGAASVSPDLAVTVSDMAALRRNVDRLVRVSTFGAAGDRGTARWLLWELGQACGIRPASIHDLYLARGRGETATDYTVPAMNLRVLAFDAARAVFRAALARDVGAMIFEIARSEIGYTDQRPAEYLSAVVAAAIREGYTGPVFVQGDHFQVSAKRFREDPEAELAAVRDLAAEALAAGFYNIDIDTSTLVDLDQPDLAAQQHLNASLCADLTAFVRGHEPAGVTASVGGEIGEVGGKNSTEPELRAFMEEYNQHLAPGVIGLSKISVQTGTSHGGVVLPDGRLEDVKVDFETLAHLSHVAREEYGLAGAVQHGASTLPEVAFGRFAEAGACEVHLATNFQNMLFDRLPADLTAEIRAWLFETRAADRKAGETDDQFVYKSRKQAIGPFKAAMWSLPEETRAEIGAAWEAQFGLLFERLNVARTHELVGRFVDAPAIHKRPADYGSPEGLAEDVDDLAD